MLNTYLHHLLDRPWRDRPPDAPLIRVADDVLVLCRTEAEAAGAYAVLKQLASNSGMTLKGTPGSAIRNLAAGQPVVWLGYELRRNDSRLQARLTERLWRSLERRIRDCHAKPDPPVRAVEVVRGWVDQLGPAYPKEDTRQLYERVIRVAAAHGIEELPPYEEVLERWSAAHERWEEKRDGATPVTRAARGSARAVDTRAASGPLPGGPPERGAPPGTTSDIGYRLSPSAACTVDGGPGTWFFFLLTEGGEVVAARRGSSPRTTRERIELLAVLRGLEAVPAGARVRLLLGDGGTADGIREMCRAPDRTGADGPPGLAGRAADLWRRLAGALERCRPVAPDLAPSPGDGSDGSPGEPPSRPVLVSDS